MLGALALALQLAAGTPEAAPAQLLVRAPGRQAVVPVVGTNAGPALRADLLAAALQGTVQARDHGRWAVTLPGVVFDVAEQVPFVREGDDVLPIAVAPFRDGERLYLPFQLVTEYLPARGTGVIYDARLGELRLFVPGALTGDVAVRSRPGAQRQNPRAGARDARDSRDPARSGDTPTVAAARTSEASPPPPTRTRSQRRVVVDAGHGGPDRGMGGPIQGGPRIHEKEITLAVAKRVAAALRARGIDVVMTRTTDTLIALSDRGRIANASRGDLFLSIHVNAANMKWKSPGAARGFETYFLAEAKTEDARRVEQMENEAVRFETGADAPRGDPLSFIINDMAQNEHLRESSDLATAIQQGLGRVHPGPNRGVKQANFAVLRTSFMPAVLIELGFGTNRDEAAFLARDAEQRRMAESIADATMAYLARYERRIGVGGR